MWDIYQIATDPGFARIMGNFATLTLFLSISITLIAFVYYDRSPLTADGQPADPWDMLLATWRDSLLITVLVTSQSLLFRYTEFGGLSQTELSTALFPAYFLIQPVLSFVADILIFIVAILRIIALTRWQAARRNAT